MKPSPIARGDWGKLSRGGDKKGSSVLIRNLMVVTGLAYGRDINPQVMNVKSLLVGVALAIFINTESLRAADEKSEAAEQAIKKLEQEWAKALVKGDQAAIDRVEAPDWMLSDPDGNLITKAKAEADLKSGVMVFESVQNDELKIRVFGDAAIAYGLVTEKLKYHGKDMGGQFRFTDVFIRRNGHWQAVSTHLSRVQ